MQVAMYGVCLISSIMNCQIFTFDEKILPKVVSSVVFGAIFLCLTYFWLLVVLHAGNIIYRMHVQKTSY